MFMKFLSRRNGIVLGSVLMLSMFLVSCKKDKGDDLQNPAAALMAFNLAPDQSAVSFRLSGNQIPGGALSYSSYTGQYFNIFPGNRSIEAINMGGELLDSLTYSFQPEKYYSLFLVGNADNYRNIVTVDNYDSLTASSGKSFVRYINGLSNSTTSAVGISAGGSALVSDNAAFGSVSEFIAVDPGDITVTVSNDGSVNSSRTISVAQSKAYTILLMGLPNQTDSTKAVQIRYVENGTVTD